MSTIIIAEAGVNHNADMDIAIKLIDEACKAKADIVKFQTAVPSEVVTKFGAKAIYQNDPNFKSESQLEMTKRIHLPIEKFKILQNYCEKKKIEFLTTSFGPISTNYIKTLKMKYAKIPSGEITNLPYLEAISQFNSKIILSTGMSSIKEIEAALDVLYKNGVHKKNITLLHCISEYPANFKDLNLNVIKNLQKLFKLNVGYSDHSPGIEASIAAVSLGAKIIEKHFTIDKNLEGPDHKASLDPKELQQMIKSIRNIELAMGGYERVVSTGENENKKVVRKSIVASNIIKKGDIFTEDNITCKRPGTGISPMQWYNVIGSTAKKTFEEDEMIFL